MARKQEVELEEEMKHFNPDPMDYDLETPVGRAYYSTVRTNVKKPPAYQNGRLYYVFYGNAAKNPYPKCDTRHWQFEQGMLDSRMLFTDMINEERQDDERNKRKKTSRLQGSSEENSQERGLLDEGSWGDFGFRDKESLKKSKEGKSQTK